MPCAPTAGTAAAHHRCARRPARKATSAASAISRKQAAVGFCFGGGNVLELARTGADVQAVVCLHGDLLTPHAGQDRRDQSRGLRHARRADPVVPKRDRDVIEAEMDAAGAKWQMLMFGGLLHSFGEEETIVPGIAEFDRPRRARATRWSTISSPTLSPENCELRKEGSWEGQRHDKKGACFGLVLAAPQQRTAQTYPDRPIRLIVSIAAGSVTDVIMRAAATELAPRLGQPLIIENRGGATGILGRASPARRRRPTATRCA